MAIKTKKLCVKALAKEGFDPDIINKGRFSSIRNSYTYIDADVTGIIVDPRHPLVIRAMRFEDGCTYKYTFLPKGKYIYYPHGLCRVDEYTNTDCAADVFEYDMEDDLVCSSYHDYDIVVSHLPNGEVSPFIILKFHPLDEGECCRFEM